MERRKSPARPWALPRLHPELRTRLRPLEAQNRQVTDKSKRGKRKKNHHFPETFMRLYLFNMFYIYYIHFNSRRNVWLICAHYKHSLLSIHIPPMPPPYGGSPSRAVRAFSWASRSYMCDVCSFRRVYTYCHFFKNLIFFTQPYNTDTLPHLIQIIFDNCLAFPHRAVIQSTRQSLLIVQSS